MTEGWGGGEAGGRRDGGLGWDWLEGADEERVDGAALLAQITNLSIQEVVQIGGRDTISK